jgi:hypothetical protein
MGDVPNAPKDTVLGKNSPHKEEFVARADLPHALLADWDVFNNVVRVDATSGVAAEGSFAAAAAILAAEAHAAKLASATAEGLFVTEWPAQKLANAANPGAPKLRADARNAAVARVLSGCAEAGDANVCQPAQNAPGVHGKCVSVPSVRANPESRSSQAQK